MAITRQKKEEVITKTKEAVQGADSVVFVNFHGLSVGDTTKLRKELKDQGVGYLVAKKTLVKRALGESNIEGDLPALDGELAIAYAADLIAPAREVYKFQKEHEGNIAILGGVFEGKFMDQSQMTAIASIPPTQVLYGQFVNLINSPIQRLAVALDQIAQKKEA